jgi:hypothetical protein
MAILNNYVDARPSVVWEVLGDGWSYADWVVGTGAILAVDDGWPQVGSCLTYRAGMGPASWEAVTISRVCEPARRLELEVDVPHLTAVRVAFEIIPWGEGTVIVFDEHPLRGGISMLSLAPLDVVMMLRNRRTLHNFARVITRHAKRAPAGG